jgi:hypothetical protein
MYTQQVEIEFSVHYRCSFGQTIYVSGSANELGGWIVICFGICTLFIR